MENKTAKLYSLELTEQQIWALLWAAERADMSLDNYDEEDLKRYGYTRRLMSLQAATKKLDKALTN